MNFKQSQFQAYALLVASKAVLRALIQEDVVGTVFVVTIVHTHIML